MEGGLCWPGPPQLRVHRSQMEIYISDWTHKFQNKTGLDAKANSELYKSNQVNSVDPLMFPTGIMQPCKTENVPGINTLQ
jgi:hypothetical protein